MRLICLFAVLLVAGIPAAAAPVTVNTVSICAQFTCDFDTQNAELTGPLSVGTGGDTSLYSTLDSAQFCVDGSPGCIGGGLSGDPFLRMRFTGVDIHCDAATDCTDYGLAFTFTGTVNGAAIFSFYMEGIDWSVPSGAIRGNMYMQLKIGDTYLPYQFLTFDSSAGTTFGPTTPILVIGHGGPFTAFGGIIVYDMPAGSSMSIPNSGNFEFTSVPEPEAFSLVLAGLAAGLLARLVRTKR